MFQTRRPERQGRRQFVARSAAVAAAGIAGGLLPVRALADAISTVAGAPQFETAEQQTPFGKATSFNNFYEFGTEIHMLTNGLGEPIAFRLTAGQAAEYPEALPLLEGRQAEAVLALVGLFFGQDL